MPHVDGEAGTIQHIRIVQIAPLAPGWWLDEWNRCPGMALVEFTDNNGDVFQDVLPLGEDLQVNYPNPDVDFSYVTSMYGDDSQFIQFKSDSEVEKERLPA